MRPRDASLRQGCVHMYAQSYLEGDQCCPCHGGASVAKEQHPHPHPQPKNVRAAGKVKKRVGRPLGYDGDINSPLLTETERRKVKRRLANRESARRVRTRRQESLHDLQSEVEALHQQNQGLLGRLERLQVGCAAATAQLSGLRGACRCIARHSNPHDRKAISHAGMYRETKSVVLDVITSPASGPLPQDHPCRLKHTSQPCPKVNPARALGQRMALDWLVDEPAQELFCLHDVVKEVTA